MCGGMRKAVKIMQSLDWICAASSFLEKIPRSKSGTISSPGILHYYSYPETPKGRRDLNRLIKADNLRANYYSLLYPIDFRSFYATAMPRYAGLISPSCSRPRPPTLSPSENILKKFQDRNQGLSLRQAYYTIILTPKRLRDAAISIG